MLCANNKVIHGCKEVSCNNNFEDKNKNIYIHGEGYNYKEPNRMYGVFVHTDCWKFIKNEYQIELNYSMLPIVDKNILSPKIFGFVNYGAIEKYWEQNFNFISLITDNNDDLCVSPLKSESTKKQIKKVFLQLKIRNDTERKGPLVSATFYKNNLYKVGTNGNIWVSKNNKWLEIKNTIKYTKVNNKIIKNCVEFGDVNKIPLFILNKNVVLTIENYL